MATKVSEFRFENDYTDSVGSNNGGAQGSGNSFVTSPVKRGTYSLQTNGSGYMKVTGDTGIPTGNNDLSFGGFFYDNNTSLSHGLGGLGVSSANSRQNIYVTRTSATNFRVDLGSDSLDFTVPSMSNDTWYHLWVQYTASTRTTDVYLDNVQSSSGAQAHAGDLNLAASTNIVIGADIDGNVTRAGNLDQWEFWTGVTSAGERAQIYNPSTFIPKVVFF